MEQFGVSRPTLREAFRLLEADQLIEYGGAARRGTRASACPDAAAPLFGLLLTWPYHVRDVYEAAW